MTSGGTFKTWFIISVSLLLAILLSILSLPDWAIWLRPQWVLLVVIYWALALPQRFSIGIAWLIGLFLDILYGTLLGEHALVLALITYIVLRFHHRIQLFYSGQRLAMVFGLILLNQILLFLIQSFLGRMSISWHYWISPFTSILFWLWIYSLLRACQRRFKIMEESSLRSFTYM